MHCSTAECPDVPTCVTVSDHASADRGEIETFIHSCFRRTYGADVREFMPRLMALRDDQGRVVASLGLRDAGEGPLFLEQYLDRRIENAIAAAAQRPVSRAHTVEIGNLAAATAGGGRWLIAAMTAYLHAAGYQWVSFTIGPVLQNAFRRMGLNPIDLGPATQDRVPQPELWGSYYQQGPRVMAGHIAEGYATLVQNPGPLHKLWEQAGLAGWQAA